MLDTSVATIHQTTTAFQANINQAISVPESATCLIN